jgi:hypothetical protein
VNPVVIDGLLVLLVRKELLRVAGSRVEPLPLRVFDIVLAS